MVNIAEVLYPIDVFLVSSRYLEIQYTGGLVGAGEWVAGYKVKTFVRH